MKLNILIAAGVTIVMLWIFGALFDSAMADVTGAGSTTNDQVASLQTHPTPWCVGCCLLYTSPSPRDGLLSRMPSSA